MSGGWGWAGVGGWGWGWAVVLGAGTGAEAGAEARLEHFRQPLCEGGRARPEILRLNRVPEVSLPGRIMRTLLLGGGALLK